MRDIVLDLRQMVTQIAGMMVGGAAGILLASTLEMGGVALLLFFVLSILCGGWLGLLAGRGLTAALNRRWQTRYGRELEDVPLVILSPYRPNSSPHDLVERLDQSAGLMNAGGGGVTREDFEHARLLVMRALHAEQIEHRADAAYVAAESFLNTLPSARSV